MIWIILLSLIGIPGIDRIEVDGMEILPNVPLCDPRPLSWIDGESGALLHREIVVTIYCAGEPFTWATLSPIARSIRVDLKGTDGERITYEWQYCGPRRTGDLDGDGDIDQEDFGFLQRCFTDQFQMPNADCWEADLNGDASIDKNDMTILLDSITGDNG